MPINIKKELKELARKSAHRAWTALSVPKRFKRLPKQLHIETTNVCNLNCEYCVINENVAHKHVMKFSDFEQLDPYFKYMHRISLSGLAEPFLNKNISKFIGHIKNKNIHCSVSLFSNLSLLTEDLCHNIIDARLDQLEFSIDADDPDVHDSIRIGSSLIQIIDILKKLSKIKSKKASAYPALSAATVMQKKNYRHLPEILRTVSGLGVRQLNVNGLEPYKIDLVGDALWYPPNIPDDLPDILEESLRTAEEEGIILKLPEFRPVAPYCQDVAIPFILSNGDVTSCAVLAYERDGYYKVNTQNRIVEETGKNNRKIFGNVFEDSLEKIWSNREYFLFRDRVLQRKFPSECQSCLIKHQIICIRSTTSPQSIIENLRILTSQ